MNTIAPPSQGCTLFVATPGGFVCMEEQEFLDARGVHDGLNSYATVSVVLVLAFMAFCLLMMLVDRDRRLKLPRSAKTGDLYGYCATCDRMTVATFSDCGCYSWNCAGCGWCHRSRWCPDHRPIQPIHGSPILAA